MAEALRQWHHELNSTAGDDNNNNDTNEHSGPDGNGEDGNCQGHSTHGTPSELKTRKSSQSYWCLGFQTLLLPVGCPSTQKTR